MPQRRVFDFGPFRLIPEERQLLRDGSAISLTPKVFDLLVYLTENRNRLVTRDELLKALWPDSIVEESNLTVNISTLRRVLGQVTGGPVFIETVPKQGYRFVADVTAPEEKLAAPAVVAVPVAEPVVVIRRSFAWLPWVVAAGVIAVAGAGYSVWSSSRPRPVLRALPLTSYTGNEMGVSFSPDGTRVTFSWGRPGQGEGIFVKLVGAGEPQRLTHGSRDEFCPAWSPDGTRIAFLRYAEQPDSVELMLIPATGGTERMLSTYPFPTTLPPCYLSWSPDGKWLVSPESPGPGKPSYLSAISVETGSHHQITTLPAQSSGDGTNALSPDGKFLVFGRYETSAIGDLYAIAIEPEGFTAKGAPVRLTTVAGYLQGVAFAPGGRELVFSGGQLYSHQLYRLRFQPGSKPTPEVLLGAGEDGVCPALVAASGKTPARLAYSRSGHVGKIQRIELGPDRKPGAQQDWAESTRVDHTPHISPDGTKVAFASTRSGSWEIWTCEAAGRDCVQLTNFGSSLSRNPQWSPDGKEIVFDSRIDGQADVYKIASTGGKPVRMTTEPSMDYLPTWSLDGKWIYFSSNRSGGYEIWKMPSGGGKAVAVATGGGRIAMESLDGRNLYISHPTTNMVTQLPLEGGKETVLATGVRAYQTLAAARSGLYFLSVAGPDPLAWIGHVDLRTGKVTRLMEKVTADGNGFTVSPDEKWMLLAYSNVSLHNEDLMLVDGFQ